MAGTNLTYNHILLQNVLTRTFEQEIVFDDSGTDPLYKKTLITVAGYVHNIAGAGPGGVFPQNGATTTDTYAYIQRALNTPRQALQMTVGTATLLQCDATTDVNNGPKPKSLKITQIAGTQVFRVEFTIECAVVDCQSSSNQSGVLNNRWSMEDAIDRNFFTTRSIRGKLRVASANLNPQAFRGWVIPPLQNGFRRDSMNFVTSTDGLTIEYAIADVQEQAAPPPPITSWSCDHTEGTNDGVSSVSEVAVHLEGKPNCNKQQLISVGAQIIEGILGKQRFDKTTMIESVAITDHVHDSSIDFQMRVRQVGKTPQEYYTATLVNMGLPLTGLVPGYDQFKWPVPSDADLASPTGLFICYLQTPCNDNHQVPQIVGPTTTGTGAYRTQPSISTSTGTLPTTTSPGYSSDQLSAMYTHYTVDSHYVMPQMRLALPIAASAASLASGSAVTAIVNLAPPQCRRVIRIVAERFGAWPTVQSLSINYADPTGQATLIGKSEVKMHAPLLSADGQNRINGIEQTLVYALPRMPQPSEFRAAGIPSVNTLAADIQVPAAAFGGIGIT